MAATRRSKSAEGAPGPLKSGYSARVALLVRALRSGIPAFIGAPLLFHRVTQDGRIAVQADGYEPPSSAIAPHLSAGIGLEVPVPFVNKDRDDGEGGSLGHGAVPDVTELDGLPGVVVLYGCYVVALAEGHQSTSLWHEMCRPCGEGPLTHGPGSGHPA
jgi:hypothetical protein